jgi:hypothetical protein
VLNLEREWVQTSVRQKAP